MPETKTRREQNREVRRALIVCAARNAFLEHGYAATSMSTIAAQLGGSKGTLWAYFPSKEDLFTAVLDDVISSFRDELDDALRPGRDCQTTLLHFSERFLLKMVKPESIRLHRLIVGEGGRFPEIGQLFYARGPKLVMERLAEYIHSQMIAGELRKSDPAEAAMTLIHLSQTQQNLCLWGVADLPDATEIHYLALRALSLFNSVYALDP